MTRRCAWGDLPADVHAAVRERTGEIARATTVDAGFSCEIAVTLDTAGGPVFVKGMREAHAEAWTQGREAAVTPYVVPLGPRVLWRVTRGGWDLLGFEHVGGRSVDLRPGSPDLVLVVDAMAALGRLACPDVELEHAGRRWRGDLDDPADARLFAGDALLHTDWNPTNVLVTDTGAVRLVDWCWATRGAGWLDPACWVVWLVFFGHAPRDAERCAARVPAWSTASGHALDVFAARDARFWRRAAGEHPTPWARGLSEAAGRWAAHRARP